MEEVWQPDLRPYGDAIRRRWWLVILFAGLGVIAASLAAGGPLLMLRGSATQMVTGSFVEPSKTALTSDILNLQGIRRRSPGAIVEVLTGDDTKSKVQGATGITPKITIRLLEPQSGTSSQVFVLTSTADSRTDAVSVADAYLAELMQIRADDLRMAVADLTAQFEVRRASINDRIAALEGTLTNDDSTIANEATVVQLQDLRLQILDIDSALLELSHRLEDPAGVEVLDRSTPSEGTAFGGLGKVMTGAIAGTVLGLVFVAAWVAMSGVVVSDDDITRKLALRLVGTTGPGQDEASLLTAIALFHVCDGGVPVLIGTGEHVQMTADALGAALSAAGIPGGPGVKPTHDDATVIRCATPAALTCEAALTGTPGCGVLVVRRHHSRRREIAATRDRLERAGTRVPGAVLVDF